MPSVPKTALVLGLLCALAACAPNGAPTRRDAGPDTDPLEANRPASGPVQKPVVPVLTR